MSRCFLLLVILASPVIAGAQTETNRLPEVIVTAVRLPGEQTAVDALPANVDVITAANIVAAPSATLPDLLRQEVGIMPFDTVGFGQFANISLRGFGEKGGVLYLVDGVRVNDAGSSDFPFLWNTVPLANVERIELIRGGASTTYGEGAIGGVVNIITKKPANKVFDMSATGAGGNLGYYAAHLAVNGKTNAFDYMASVDRQAWDGWRDSSGFKGWTALVKPGLETSIGHFSLGYYFHTETLQNPGPLTEAQYRSNPRQSGSPVFDYTNTVHRGTLDYERDFDNGWVVLGKVHGQVYDGDNSGYANVHIQQPNYGTTWQLSRHGEFFGRHNILTLGMEAIQQDFSSHLSSLFGNSLTRADHWTASVFAQDTIRVMPKLTLTTGIRYDHRTWDIDIVDGFMFDIHTNRYADVWSPKLGAVYEFSEKTDGWLTLSRSYRLPSGYDIGTASYVSGALFYPNANVQPVVANTVEIGTRMDRWQWLSGSCAYFYRHVTDDIVVNPFTYENENFDGNRQGVELTLRSQPATWVDFYYTTAYTDSRFDGGPFDGNRLPQVPEWQLTGGCNVRPLSGLQLTVEGIHVRGQVASNDVRNEFARNQYVLCNLKARYTWHNLTAFVAANNVFDRRYETFPAVKTDFLGVQTREYNPAAGINFQAGASVAF